MYDLVNNFKDKENISCVKDVSQLACLRWPQYFRIEPHTSLRKQFLFKEDNHENKKMPLSIYFIELLYCLCVDIRRLRLPQLAIKLYYFQNAIFSQSRHNI